MVETPANKSFKNIDLTKLDKATPEQIDQLRHIVGITHEQAAGMSHSDLVMNIKATLYAAYEKSIDDTVKSDFNKAIQDHRVTEGEMVKKGAKKEEVAKFHDQELAMSTEAATKLFKSPIIEEMKIVTQNPDLGKYDPNAFIEYLAEKGVVAKENVESYKKPAEESRKNAAKQTPKTDAKGRPVSEVIEYDKRGNNAALYDYAVQPHEGTGHDKPFLDTQKLQGMLESSLLDALRKMEEHPLENNNPQARDKIKMLREDLGMQVMDGSGAKQNIDDARTQEALKAAKDAKGK